MEELSLELIGFLREYYPGVIHKRYDVPEEGRDVEILEAIAKVRLFEKRRRTGLWKSIWHPF